MRLSLNLITISFLSTAQAARYLPANQPCGNNKECESNCGKATYHIASSGNSTYFACTFDGNALYDFGLCEPLRTSEWGKDEKLGFTQSQLKGVCEAAAGKDCRGLCIFLPDNRDDFSNACAEIKGKPQIKENLSYDKAMSHCKKP
jgi:hypothetical protein